MPHQIVAKVHAVGLVALMAGLSLVTTGCSSAPEVMLVKPDPAMSDYKNYLTADEKRLPREPGPPVDRAGQPRYPDQALNFGQPGSVEVVVTIGPDGRVSATRIVSETPAGWGFGIAAEEWIRRWRFSESGAPKRLYFYRQHFRMK